MTEARAASASETPGEGAEEEVDGGPRSTSISDAAIAASSSDAAFISSFFLLEGANTAGVS